MFFDRLVDDGDRNWFLTFLKDLTEKQFGSSFNDLFSHLVSDGGEVNSEHLRKCFFFLSLLTPPTSKNI